jgi:salicylate hydroxylase
VESWTELGTHAEIAADFAGWNEHIQMLLANIDAPFKWAIFLHPTMTQWSIGRATLLGDACHATLPYLAMGANMAIEDGFVLACCIEHDADDIPRALKRYEALRIPRTTDIVNASAANLGRYHHPDLADPEKSRSYVDNEARSQQVSRQWLYEYDPTTLAL